MKAIDYYKAHATMFYSAVRLSDVVEEVSVLLQEFANETQEIINKRHAKFMPSIAAVMKEQNQKWNALCSMFEKKHGCSPIRRDAYKEAVIKEIPLLKEYL